MPWCEEEVELLRLLLLSDCRSEWEARCSCAFLLRLAVYRHSRHVTMMQSWRKTTAAAVAMTTGRVVHNSSPSSSP
jgi:hypothetical protein